MFLFSEQTWRQTFRLEGEEMKESRFGESVINLVDLFLPADLFLLELTSTLTNCGNKSDKPTSARIPIMIGVRSGKAASSAPYAGAGSPYEAAGSP